MLFVLKPLELLCLDFKLAVPDNTLQPFKDSLVSKYWNKSCNKRHLQLSLRATEQTYAPRPGTLKKTVSVLFSLHGDLHSQYDRLRLAGHVACMGEGTGA